MPISELSCQACCSKLKRTEDSSIWECAHCTRAKSMRSGAGSGRRSAELVPPRAIRKVSCNVDEQGFAAKVDAGQHLVASKIMRRTRSMHSIHALSPCVSWSFRHFHSRSRIHRKQVGWAAAQIAQAPCSNTLAACSRNCCSIELWAVCFTATRLAADPAGIRCTGSCPAGR